MAVMLMCLLSCKPDCKDVTIQKVEWKTRYEDYYIQKDTIEEICGYVDTLVSYSVVKHTTKTEYRRNAKGELTGSSTVHYITIRNNNDSYSNRFAIKLTGKEYIKSSNKWEDLYRKTDYITILPQSSYTFSIRHPSWWRNDDSGYNESNVSISILQESTNIYRALRQVKRIKQKKTRRIDDLVISDTVVNNCECDIDALNERYATIREIFNKLKNEHLITD